MLLKCVIFVFLCQREIALRREFEKIKEADRTYKFSVRKWFPSNWVVSRRDDVYNTHSGQLITTRLEQVYTQFSLIN